MNDTTYIEQLEKDGYVLVMTVGVSMEPMLRQRTEQLMIEKCTAPLKNNDVVLFRRKSGQYVLHRIVSKRKDHYLIRGDNCYGNEKVYPQQIVGILKGFYRGETYISCTENRAYRCYVVLWRLGYPFRLGGRKLKSYARGLLSKLRR